MRPEDNAAVRAVLNIDQDRGRVRIISSEGALGGVVEAVRAVDEGHIVSIMGDRPYGYRSLEAEFLGERVHFPIGGLSIAAAAQCPVVVLLSAKVSANQYVVDVSHVIEPPAGAGRIKQEAMGRCVREFGRILEDYVTLHPYQWFVFADIWKRDEEQEQK
jgi:predicted LPLAT superfamily acyltransferase